MNFVVHFSTGIFPKLSSDPAAEVFILQSIWNRSITALRRALELYRERHPGTYATIIIDEPTACMPFAYSASKTVSTLQARIINDLATIAVYFGCDIKTAQFVFSSSSPAIRFLTGMLAFSAYVFRMISASCSFLSFFDGYYRLPVFTGLSL